MNKYFISVIILFIIFFLIWLAFLKEVPLQTCKGVIVSKTYQPPRTQHIYQGRRSATKIITITDSYLFKIKSDSTHEEITYSTNVVNATKFNVNQRVLIFYKIRGINPFWQMKIVEDLKILE